MDLMPHQLDSILTLAGDGGRSHRLGVQSHSTASTLDTGHKPMLSPVFATDWDPFFEVGNLLKWFTKLRETFIHVYQIILKDILKGAEEEVLKMRSRRVLGT